MKLWQIAACVAAGIIAGEIAPGALTGLFSFVTFHVFLPAIIFEAAWQLDFSIMKKAWRPIVLLAVPGVVITASTIAAIVYFLGHVTLAAALLLGTVLSATDPIAVTAIFRRLKVPQTLSTIVESESLLNDAIAVVLYRAVLAAVAFTGVSMRLAPVAGQAVLGTILGIVTGVLLGYAGSFGLRRRVPVALQMLVTFAAAYGSYILADRLGWSGIFAVFSCAVTMRELERNYVTLDMQRIVGRAWHAAASFSNAVLFFLIGASVELLHLWSLRFVLGWTLVGVLASRAIVAYGLLRLAPRMLRSWMTVVRLAGVRGAIALALALSVPREIPQANVVIDATFAVVVVTVIIGSLTYSRRIGALELG